MDSTSRLSPVPDFDTPPPPTAEQRATPAARQAASDQALLGTIPMSAAQRQAIETGLSAAPEEQNGAEETETAFRARGIEMCIAEIWGNLMSLYEAYQQAGFDEYDLEALAPWLRDLSQVLVATKELQTAAAERVAALMDRKNMVVNGVQLDWGEKTGSTQWDDQVLLPVLIQKAHDLRLDDVDPETGELRPFESVVLDILRDTAAISYFRANRSEGTGLYKYGIDPDEYRTKATGPRRAKVIGEKR